MKHHKIVIDNIEALYIKINGKTEVEHLLKPNFLYDIKARIETEDRGGLDPDYKGAKDWTYKTQLVACDVIDEVGKVIKTKVKGSPSQRLRNRILGDFAGPGDPQFHYEQNINDIIINWPEVKEFLKSLKDGES